MKQKFETFETFKEFRSEVEKQVGKSLKTFQSDQGVEHLDTKFTIHLS